MQKIGNESTKALPARDRILLTAHELFYRDGIRATGIDRVIADSGVTKVTFYRHFPSKNDLIYAYLEYRHQCWMAWFTSALQRRGSVGQSKNLNALAAALAEWFRSDQFRGCAFINSVVELGSTLPDVVGITQRHKQEMTAAIENLLPPSRRRKKDAQAIALAVDGAIVRAQMDETPDAALDALLSILKTFQANMM